MDSETVIMPSDPEELIDPLNSNAPQGGPNWMDPKRLMFTESRVQWARVWSTFPVYTNKRKLSMLLKSFKNDDVTILVSGTGSGKTVLVPPLMLRQHTNTTPPSKIIVTMPKRATTLAAAKRGAVTFDVTLGQEVGYRFRGSNVTSSNTRVIYATDGTVLSMIRRDPSMRHVDAIIIDEAHERPVPTDFLLQAVRAAVISRKETTRPLHLVVMSATMDPKPFQAYFQGAGLLTSTILFPTRPNHQIQKHFLPSRATNAIQQGVAKVVDLLNKPGGQGHVIMFVPTTRDAVGGCSAFSISCKRSKRGAACNRAICNPLYGRQDREEQLEALLNSQTEKDRKLYIATNIAESSLTINDVTHVVDTGLQVANRWQPLVHGTVVEIEFASRAQLDQRMGRTGRTSPGEAHLMYTLKEYESLPMYPEPTIRTVDLTEHVFALVQDASIKDVLRLLSELVTPPTDDQVRGALAFLSFYKLIVITSPLDWRRFSISDECNGTLTPWGKAIFRITQRMKLSVDLALVVGLSARTGDPETIQAAFDLAAILEMSQGGVDPLWKSGNGEPSSRPDPALASSLRSAGIDSHSDHVSLVVVLRNSTRVETHLLPKVWKSIHKRGDELRRFDMRWVSLRDSEFDQSPCVDFGKQTTHTWASKLARIVVEARGFHRCKQRWKDTTGYLPTPIASIHPHPPPKISRILKPSFIHLSRLGQDEVEFVYETFSVHRGIGQSSIITIV